MLAVKTMTKPSTKAAFVKEVNAVWNKYVPALESDYRNQDAIG